MGYYDSEYEKYYGSLRGKLNYTPGYYGEEHTIKKVIKVRKATI